MLAKQMLSAKSSASKEVLLSMEILAVSKGRRFHYLGDRLGIGEKVVPQLAGIVAARA
jgi:hypothetical protein